MNFQMFKLDLEKAEEPEIKLPTSVGSLKKRESFRKTSALLTMPKPLTVWITTNWKSLKEMGIPDHPTCLLRNLFTGQEATVRTGNGTTDWFQIGKLLLSHFSHVQLCNPIDGSPPGSPVPGILQARTLEWVAISFSNA